tara:strand:+ start:287 stop:544 length:258 start_codon:yes stop_codon:yes gene_type:complete
MTDINKRYPSREARRANRNMGKLNERRKQKRKAKHNIPERIRDMKAGIEMIKLLQQKDPAYRNERIKKFLDVLEESIKEMQEELQ